LISIATRPQISDEILANCGVLIIFKNHMQRGFLCELLNLDEENEDYVSILEEGQCIARVNSVKRPFLLSVPYIQRHWLKRGDINSKNKMILKKIKENEKIATEKEVISRKILENSKKDTQKNHNKQKFNDMFKEAAEIKYSVDNSFKQGGHNRETFNAENYRLCLECKSIVEKNDKNCPYCGSYLS